MVRLNALGTIDLRHEDGRRAASVLAQSKRLALLSYLTIDGPVRHRRDTLLGVFWPDLDEPRARHALRQSLHVLRRSLGPSVVVTNGDDEVGVDSSRISCDVLELRSAVEVGNDELVLDLYRGELLPGLSIGGAPEFERWLTVERERARRAVVDAARRLATRAQYEGDDVAAETFARRLREIAPYDESAVRQLMRVLHASGRRAEAIRAYETLSARLAADLELEPGAETRTLLQEIRGIGGDVEAPVPAPEASEAPSPPAIDRGTGDDDPSAPVTSAESPAELAAEPMGRGWLLPLAAVLIPLLVIGTAVVRGWTREAEADPGSEVLAARQDAGELSLEPTRLLVMPLVDETGDPALAQFGRVAADWLIHALHGTRLVEVISTEAVLGALAQDSSLSMGETRSTLELARRMGAATLLTGGYTLVGDSLRIRASLIDVRDGTVGGVAGPIIAAGTDPASALDPLVERVTGLVASHYDARVSDQAHWRNPPAYEAYEKLVHAVDVQRGFSAVTDSAAARLYRESYEADTTFLTPLVYAARTAITSNLLPGTADSLVAFLKPRRDRLAPVMQYELDALAAELRGDLDGRYDALRLASRMAPDRLTDFAWAALYSGRYREALQAVKRVPASEYGLGQWRLYTLALHLLGRHEEELAGAREAVARFPGSLRAYQMVLWGYAALGMRDSIFAMYRTVYAHPDIAWNGSHMMPGPAKDWLLHGNDRATADSLLREAEAWFRRMLDDPRADPCEPYLSLSETLQLMGRPEEAVAVLDETIENPELWQCPDWQPRADYSRLRVRGYAAAQAGERETALAVADSLRRRGPDSGQELFNRAEIRGYLGDRDEALELLGKAVRAGFGYHYLHLSSMPFERWLDEPEFRAFFEPRG